MDQIIEVWDAVFNVMGPSVYIVLIILTIIGVVGQWALYDKCGQPGFTCLIPFWNVISFMRIVGRPWWHMFFVVLPLVAVAACYLYLSGTTLIVASAVIGAAWIGFMIKVYIELLNSFGLRKTTDYILVILFNGFYVLNLGLSYNTKYIGPVYGRPGGVPEKKRPEDVVRKKVKPGTRTQVRHA